MGETGGLGGPLSSPPPLIFFLGEVCARGKTETGSLGSLEGSIDKSLKGLLAVSILKCSALFPCGRGHQIPAPT